jgi:hypothetical protein
VSANALIQRAREAGMTVFREGGQLRVVGERTEQTEEILSELKAAKDEVLTALSPCCGERAPGVGGEPLKLSCQLCASSPTYWRIGMDGWPS